MQRVPVLLRPSEIGPNLLDELQAIPSLAPVVEPSGAKAAVMRLAIERDEVVLDVPDDADRQAITRVIGAHVKREPVPIGPPLKSRKDRARDALAAIDSTKENKKLLAVLRELVDD